MTKRNKLIEAVKKLVKLFGLQIGVEFEPGDVRFPDTHQTLMSAFYGHIRNHIGDDGMSLDCYIGPNPDSQNIYLVHQLTASGEYDEGKIVFGCDTIQQAKSLYMAHMPKDRFGGIVPTSLSRIQQYKRNSVNTEHRIIERAANGLPLVVEIQSPYPFISDNGRDWPVEGLSQATDNTNDVILQGAVLPNYKRHPEDDYIRRVDVGNGQVVREYIPTSNETISTVLSEWIDKETNNFCSRARFDHSTKAGLDWARRADRGEQLPISIRVEGHCSLPNGHGHCYPYSNSILFWDWLDPDIGEQPGIPGSGITKIIEVNTTKEYNESIYKPAHCCNNCKDGKPCITNNLLNNSNNSNFKHNLKTESGDPLGSAQTRSDKMDFSKLLSMVQALIDQGLDDATICSCIMSWMNSSASAGEPVEDPIPDEASAKAPTGCEKALEFFKKFKKENLAKFKKKETKKEGLAGDSASMGQFLRENTNIMIESAAAAMGLTVDEYKAMGKNFKAEQEAKAIKEALEQETNTCRSTKAPFREHDLSKVEIYPPDKVQVAIEIVAKENKFLEVAKEKLEVKLEKIAFNSAKEIARKVEEDAKLKENAQRLLGDRYQNPTGSYSATGVSQRYREQQEKVVKMIVDIAQKYAPGLYAEYQRSKKECATHIQEHLKVIHAASERTYGPKLEASATFIADRKIESSAINNTNMLNFPVWMDGAMEFVYWASPVMRLVSSLPVESVNIGQPVRIQGTNKFAQFVQANSRKRSQRRRTDPRRKITSSAPTHETNINESTEQFFAVRDTSSIKIDRALITYLGQAPLFENVPEILLMHLVQEILMFRQLKVSMELVMAAQRYKLLTISNEITQDVAGERVTSSSPGVTMNGVTFPGAKTAVWMRRGQASGTTPVFGPVMQPRNKPSVNISGGISEVTEFPIHVQVAGRELTPAMLDENNNFDVINEGDDLTDCFAFHPSGVLVTSLNYATAITAGTFVITQYQKVRNYSPMSFDLPNDTKREDWGDQKVEELLGIRSEVKTKRQAALPDYFLLPENNFDKTIAHSKRIQNRSLDGLDFAKISSDYVNDTPFSGATIRGAEILTTSEPYLGSDAFFGIVGKKGKTVCQELSMPVIDGPHAIYDTDENGITRITDEDCYRLSETTFIQTLSPRDPDPNSATFGEYLEYSQTCIFPTDSPEDFGVIA